MKRYLPKNYVFTNHDGFEIKYSDIIDRIITVFYEDFRFAPSRSAIRLVFVAESFLREEYHVQILFDIIDTRKCSRFPKSYMLDFWSCSIEKI